MRKHASSVIRLMPLSSPISSSTAAMMNHSRPSRVMGTRRSHARIVFGDSACIGPQHSPSSSGRVFEPRGEKPPGLEDSPRGLAPILLTWHNDVLQLLFEERIGG